MPLASHLFSATERQAVDAAITTAERDTSGEIVVAVASASGRYDRAEDLFGLLLALLGLCGLWLAQPALDSGWDSASPLLLLVQLATVLLLFGAGSHAAARWPLLRAPFVPRNELDQEVERRAREVFQQYRLRATRGGTGVLIYVSLFEHRVRVLGDDPIAAKLQAGDWQAICNRIVQGLRSRDPARGLQAGIALAGELLARHFPRQAGDLDELPNRLVLID